MAKTGRPSKGPRILRSVSLRPENEHRLKAIAERTGLSVSDVLNDWMDVTADVYAERLAEREKEKIKKELGVKTMKTGWIREIVSSTLGPIEDRDRRSCTDTQLADRVTIPYFRDVLGDKIDEIYREDYDPDTVDDDLEDALAGYDVPAIAAGYAVECWSLLLEYVPFDRLSDNELGYWRAIFDQVATSPDVERIKSEIESALK